MNRIHLAAILKASLVAVLLIKSPTSGAAVFKCTGADGGTTYQSKPCSSENLQTEIKIQTHTANPMSDKPARAKAPAVVLYSTDWCGYCRKVRKLFKDNNIAYKEVDIEKSASAKSRYDKLGGKGVPLTTIGDQLVRGFNAERLLKLAASG